MPKVKNVKLYIAPDSNNGRVWADAEDMAELFNEYLYSDRCLNHMKKQTIIDKETCMVTVVDVPAPRSPTIKGFCLYCGATPSAWYADYADNPAFAKTVEQITAACESEARGMFEDGSIPSNLAGLWMGGYGYSTKQEQEIKGGVPVVIADDLGE